MLSRQNLRVYSVLYLELPLYVCGYEHYEQLNEIFYNKTMG